jgi:hypothetical protein
MNEQENLSQNGGRKSMQMIYEEVAAVEDVCVCVCVCNMLILFQQF